MSLLPEIHERLDQFQLITENQWFYELCYCLLTPQTKARNAELAVQQLENGNFMETGFDPIEVLRAPSHYIRFHITKAKRLLNIRNQWQHISNLLFEHEFMINRNNPQQMRELRDALSQSISGIGMKEASHFLRNIGARGLAILDRHILDHLMKLGLLQEMPAVGNMRVYRDVEVLFSQYAARIGTDMDVLDLQFWSEKTGYIGK